MATIPTAAIARLQAANGNAYDEQTNPGGLAQGGHRQNFVPDLQASVLVGQWVAATAEEAATTASEIDADAAAVEAARQQVVTKAGEAAASATQAAESAARLLGTSTTSRTPALGSLQFTTQAGKAFDVGAWLMVQSRGTVGRWAFGKVTAYSTTSVTIAVEAIGPTVTAGTDWNLLVSGGRGPVGVEPWGTPEAWAASTVYSATAPRSVVIYDGETYVATTSHTAAATFSPANWIKVAAKGSAGATIQKASAAEITAGTEDTKFATAKALADAMKPVTFAANALNLSQLINGKITLAANTTFAAPTNFGVEGQTGVLEITQDGTGGRTGSFNTAFDFGKAGVPTLSTGAGKTDLVIYTVAAGGAKLRCTFWAAA